MEYSSSRLLARKHIEHSINWKLKVAARKCNLLQQQQFQQCHLLYLPDGLPVGRRFIRQMSSVFCHERSIKAKACGDTVIWPPREVKYYAAASGYICHLDLGYHRTPCLITGLINTFTLVKFLLSWVAFTKVSVGVYTCKMFTYVCLLYTSPSPRD